MGYFSMENAVFEIVKDIFFDGTLYHLWYLPAAITGGAIAFLLVKKLGTKWAAAITLLLYLLGMVGDSLFGLIEATPAGAVYNAVFAVVGSSRNGIFFTPIFFVLGAIIAKREPLSLKKSLLGAVISYILLFFEAMALRDAALFRRDSMCIFIFLLPLIYFLFSALCGVKGERKALLRDSSMIIYIIHPFVIVVLRFVSELLGIDGVIIENNLVNFFTVTVLSVIAAFVISAVMGLFKKNGARKREETAKEQEKEPVAEPV
jgi:serine/alanine racemase